MKTPYVVLCFALSFFGRYAVTMLLVFREAMLPALPLRPSLPLFFSSIISLGIVLFYIYRRRLYRPRQLRLLFPLVFLISIASLGAIVLFDSAWLFFAASSVLLLMVGIQTAACIYLLFRSMREGKRAGWLVAVSGLSAIALLFALLAILAFTPAYKFTVLTFACLIAVLILGLIESLSVPFDELFGNEGDLFQSLDLPQTLRRKSFWGTGVSIFTASVLLGALEPLSFDAVFADPNFPVIVYGPLFVLGFAVAAFAADRRQGLNLSVVCFFCLLSLLPAAPYWMDTPPRPLSYLPIVFSSGVLIVYIMLAMLRIGHWGKNVLLAICLPGIIYNLGLGLGLSLDPLWALLPIWLKLSLMCLAVVVCAAQIYLAYAAGQPPFPEENRSEKQVRLNAVIDGYGFTARERDVLEQILAGKATKEIAQSLFISQSTVKYYVGRLLLRCEVKSRVALLAKLNQEAEADLPQL